MNTIPYRNNNRLAVILVLLAAGMIGLSFASVPLYRWFCQVTGYGGTLNTEYNDRSSAIESSAEATISTTYTVLFDANIARTLPWEFEPEVTSITIDNNELVTAYYTATNLTDRPISSTAVFNLAPHKVAAYVDKIECFCFSEQTLQPGEVKRMPVVFSVSPALLGDPNAREVKTITFSYTMYPSGEVEDEMKMDHHADS